MRIALLILFSLIILAAILLWAKLLTSMACPRCQNQNITLAKSDEKHGYGTKMECLNCLHTFYLLPLMSHRSKNHS